MSGSNEAVVGPADDGGGAVAAARHGGRVLRRVRGVTIADVAIGFLLTSLVIDGFPAGAAVLREFGARPANFLLVIACLVLIARRVMKGRALALEARESYLLVAILVGAPLLNLPVALLQSAVGAHVALVDWMKQFLMLGWGVISYCIWKRIVAEMDSRRYCALIAISAVVPVLAYVVNYFDRSGTFDPVLYFFRLGHNSRPSGLATEPSIYGAWVTFIWPLVLYCGMKGGRALARLAARVLVTVAVITAVMSAARTFAVVLVLQLVYFCFWAIQRQRGWGSRIRTLLLALCITTAVGLGLASRLMTVADIAHDESDITRIGDTVTGINVSLAHPVAGVGIGEFGNFFAQYAPDFALRSVEVENFIAGEAEYRASTFNMFVRLCVEFGIPLGLAFTALILRPVVRAPKLAMGEPFVLYAALSAVGGIGFWLSQDQYGYQPGILSLAVLSMTLAGVMRTPRDAE